MKNKVYCRTSQKGIHAFYIKVGSSEYYLFSQEYRRGVEEYYGCSVSFNEAVDFSRAKRNNAVLRTMNKIMMYSKYIEKQYGVAICKSSMKKRPKTYDRRVCA